MKTKVHKSCIVIIAGQLIPLQCNHSFNHSNSQSVDQYSFQSVSQSIMTIGLLTNLKVCQPIHHSVNNISLSLSQLTNQFLRLLFIYSVSHLWPQNSLDVPIWTSHAVNKYLPVLIEHVHQLPTPLLGFHDHSVPLLTKCLLTFYFTQKNKELYWQEGTRLSDK